MLDERRHTLAEVVATREAARAGRAADEQPAPAQARAQRACCPLGVRPVEPERGVEAAFRLVGPLDDGDGVAPVLEQPHDVSGVGSDHEHPVPAAARQVPVGEAPDGVEERLHAGEYRSYSVIIPTGYRERYLEAVLADLVAQDFPHDLFEVLVVDDTPDGANRDVVERFAGAPVAVRYVPREGPPGINSGRNTGIERSSGEIVVYVDDDDRIEPAWLAALDRGIERDPRAECFGGPIRQWIEPGHPRWCGRDDFPVTTLDHGPVDRYVDVVFGANFAVRRSTFARIGGFQGDMSGPGDEVEWILRLRRAGGLVRYVADAGVLHTRFADDVTLKKLMKTSLGRARHGADFDVRLGIVEPLPDVLRRALRFSAHAVLFRCWSAAAHAAHAYAYAWHTQRARPRRTHSR
jgi:GT2 family glycosyltransferase